jgi:16S rRNA (uracil1498-N3)-methyltransferase
LAQLQRLAIAPHQFQPPLLILTPDQQHYLYRVLRLRSGDRFIALDRQQSWLMALTAEPGQAQLVEELVTPLTELPTSVTLAAALPKGNGFDEVVRQVTELGVSRIVPLVSDRTLLHPSPQKLERWRRIAQEATEQSERQVVPALLDPLPFVSGVQQLLSPNAVGFVCVARGERVPLWAALSAQPLAQIIDLIIVIGPEGGWTEAEVERAIALSYQPVSLGPRILRAVTAPVVALSLMAAALESARESAGMLLSETEGLR